MAESIVTDVVARISADSTNFVNGMKMAENSARQMQTTVEGGSNLAQKAMTGIGVVAGAAGLAMINFAHKSFEAAARVNELDIAMRAVGTSTGLGYVKLREATLAVKKNGIEMHAAQEMVLLYAKANLDVAKATEISRVAQDLAVISQSNSTETATRLTYAIMNQDTQMLRSVGITKSASEAFNDYAVQNHVSVASLTEFQKKQAITNMIISEGAKVAGVYEAAMHEPAKVLRSFPRIFDDIQEAVGQGFTTSFGPLIVNLYHATKAFSQMVGEGGMLAPIVDAIGRAFKFMMDPLSRAFQFLAHFLEKKQELFELGEKARSTAKGMQEIEDKTRGMAEGIAKALPFIAGITTFFALTAGSSLLGALPVIGGFFAGLSALGAGFAVMVLMIPAVQKELIHLFRALLPLLKVAMDVGRVFGTIVWTAITKLMIPVRFLIDQIAKLTGWLSKNTNVLIAFFGVLGVGFLAMKAQVVVTKLWTLALGAQAAVMKGVATASLIMEGGLWGVTAAHEAAAIATAEAAAAAEAVTAAHAQAVIAAEAAGTAAVMCAADMEILAAAETAAAAEMELLNTTFAVNPFVMIIIGIALLVAAFVYLWNHSENFRKTMTKVFDAIGKAIGFVIGWILKVLGSLVEGYSHLISSSGVLGKFVISIWSAIGKAIGGYIGFVLETYGRLLKGVSELLASHGSLYKFLVQYYNAILQVVTGVISSILDAYATVLRGVGLWLAGMISFGEMWTQVWNGLFKIAKNLGSFIFQILKGLGKAVWNLGKDIVNGMVNWAKGVLGAHKEVEDSTQAIGDHTESWGVKVGKTFITLSHTLSEWASKVRHFGNVNIGTKIVDTLGKSMGVAGDTLLKWAKTAKSFGNSVGDIAKSMVDSISKGASAVGDWLTNTGDKIIEFTANGVTRKVIDTVTSFMGNMGDMFGGLDKLTGNFGKKIDTTADKLDKGLKKVGATAAQLAKTAADAGKAQLEAMKNEAQKVLEFAQSAIDDTNRFGGIMSLGASEETPVTAEMIVANLQQRLTAITKFGENLRKLRQMGLNDSSFQEIVGAGPLAGGKMAQALIDAGKSAIGQVNSFSGVTGSITLASDYIGDQAIKSRYGANTGLMEQRGIMATTVQTFASGAFQFHFGAGIDAKTQAVMTKQMKTAIHSAFVQLQKDLKKK